MGWKDFPRVGNIVMIFGSSLKFNNPTNRYTYIDNGVYMNRVSDAKHMYVYNRGHIH